MADRKDKSMDDEMMNPRNMAGARRLMNDPKMMDRALDEGLGELHQRPDPTYDDTRKRK